MHCQELTAFHFFYEFEMLLTAKLSDVPQASILCTYSAESNANRFSKSTLSIIDCKTVQAETIIAKVTGITVCMISKDI